MSVRSSGVGKGGEEEGVGGGKRRRSINHGREYNGMVEGERKRPTDCKSNLGRRKKGRGGGEEDGTWERERRYFQ